MNKLKDLRLQHGLSLRRLGDLTGISHTQLSRIERGEQDINGKIAVILANFFDVSIDYLVGFSDDEPAIPRSFSHTAIERLTTLRKQQCLSARKLGESTGISQTKINKIERGEQKISTPQAVSLADYFNVSVDYLLGYSSDELTERFLRSIIRDMDPSDIEGNMRVAIFRRLVEVDGLENLAKILNFLSMIE